MSELIAAARTGDQSAIKRFIAIGVSVHECDVNGWTALHWAAGKGNLESIRLLIRAGADPLKTGRDMRTPHMIALAASHLEAAKILQDAERHAGEVQREERQYRKAYRLRELLAFPGWRQGSDAGKNSKEPGPEEGRPDLLSPNSIVYLDQDYVVRRSSSDTQDPIFDSVTDEWKHFCAKVLKFKVPKDLELAASGQTQTTS